MQRECTPTQQEEEEEGGSRPRSQLTGIIYIAPERVWALFSEVLETRSQLPAGRTYLPPPSGPLPAPLTGAVPICF